MTEPRLNREYSKSEPSNGWIRQGQDVITLEVDSNVFKAIMSCGHVISSKSMREYCKYELKNGKSTINCPAFKCEEKWPFSACKSVMKESTSRKQMQKMEKQISINYISGLKKVEPCTKCQYFLEKPENVTTDRVSCPRCEAEGRKGYFCWFCKKPWISNSDRKCGNEDCDRGAKKLKILATCPEKVILKRFAPSVRGCPNCGLLIEYTSQCSQMLCPECKIYFCFFCLKIATTKKDLTCIPYDSECVIAARQTSLPDL